jgi:hypothetical protein
VHDTIDARLANPFISRPLGVEEATTPPSPGSDGIAASQEGRHWSTMVGYCDAAAPSVMCQEGRGSVASGGWIGSRPSERLWAIWKLALG